MSIKLIKAIIEAAKLLFKLEEKIRAEILIAELYSALSNDENIMWPESTVHQYTNELTAKDEEDFAVEFTAFVIASIDTKK